MRNDPFRRRRAVLALLVGVALVLLTASFGSADSGPLHPVRTVVMTVLGPIEDGANAVFKPVRDLFGWFGSTIDAKGEAKRLKKERNELRRQIVDGRAALAANDRLRRLVGLSRRLGLADYGPVSATVIGRSPTVWFATVQIDHGSDDGVKVNQPVVDGDGLVGTVSAVTPGTAVVTLITDRESGVSARIIGPGDEGTVVAAGGDPGMLSMELVSPRSRVRVGEPVVTSGTTSGPLASLFPPNLPVAMVSAVDANQLRADGTIDLKPLADLNHLDTVVVLTRSAWRP